ncbi:MAG: 4Fe-4S binding protein [Clostridiales bacterium]|nr:4Fe-4S binding protein [Clostridiales bacterium]
MDKKRHIAQFCAAALSNGYLKGFYYGKIFTGPSKGICLPGLNCYSCPGALCACPIGAMQATLGSSGHKSAFYVGGFLIIIGALMGRLVCGWLCPFGLVQDLLHKISFVKKIRRLPGDRWLKWLRYLILALFVILLPLLVLDITGQGKPWFCEYICPAGTLEAGIPLVLLDKGLRSVIGWLYVWKVALLAMIILLSVIVYRPFCRYLCPLGAIYGLFNPISIYRYEIDSNKCVKCGQCQDTCKLNIKVYEKPNSLECIKCGNCKKVCPNGAITNEAIINGLKNRKEEDDRRI